MIKVVTTMSRLNSTLCKPRALFIDLSGTIHIEDKIIPNSIDALKFLSQSKFPHLFVTNTSKVCEDQIAVIICNLVQNVHGWICEILDI